MSAQKALQGSETETMEFLGGTEEKGVFPGKSMICFTRLAPLIFVLATLPSVEPI